MHTRMEDELYDAFKLAHKKVGILEYHQFETYREIAKHIHRAEEDNVVDLVKIRMTESKLRHQCDGVPPEFFHAYFWNKKPYSKLHICHCPEEAASTARGGWLCRFPTYVKSGYTLHDVHLQIRDVIISQILVDYVSPDLLLNIAFGIDDYFNLGNKRVHNELFDSELERPEVFYFYVYEEMFPDAMGRSPSNIYYDTGSSPHAGQVALPDFNPEAIAYLI